MTTHHDEELGEECVACGRPVLVGGDVNRMEAALDAHGSAPVIEWLRSWLARPRRSRSRRLADLVAALEDFADHPERLRRNEVNALAPGIWELKVGMLRLPFAAGRCPGDRTEALGRSLCLPELVPQAAADERCARVTHGFEKRTTRTPRYELDRALAIAREDARK